MKYPQISPEFWGGKRIFLTGHTGFKGSWASLWLTSMGARVTGYALTPNTTPNLFGVLGIDELIERSHIADILDMPRLEKAINEAAPEIVIHMAAQPLVHHSYENPVETYATNVMGTVHILEAVRRINTVRATLIVTTDKCYDNKELIWGYRENESMGGNDPYSSSKGCAELVTSAYRHSYFDGGNSTNQVASARAGNVIGGGDWSSNRLIPDAIRSFELNQTLMIRNPMATRPWQHVLEPLSGYLILAQALHEEGANFASGWNFGPMDEDNRSVEEVIEILISAWKDSARWQRDDAIYPHEATLLKLDCSKARLLLGWVPRWNLNVAIQKIVDWQKAYQAKENMQTFSLQQIKDYQLAHYNKKNG